MNDNPWVQIYANLGKKKKQRTCMKKEKIPTQCKTKKCSICRKSGTTITVNGQKFVRCKQHIIQYNMRNEEIKPDFKKASRLPL